MDCTILVNVALLATFGSPVEGKLLVKPRDTDAKVNQSTYFNCSTNHGSTAIFWFHGSIYVYTGISILEPYNERFKIDRYVRNGTYIYNLVIRSVQLGDAGQYICVDDEGIGDEYSIQLVVLDGDPICRSNIELDKVIGQNTCNVEPDDVELSCSVTYHGNIPPQLEWKKDGDDKNISEVSSNTSTNHYYYILKLKGDISLDKSWYFCQATRTVQPPHQCVSRVINVMYALSDNSIVNRTINDEIICHANTTQLCNYQWRWFKKNDVTTESSSSILKPRKVGLHKCEAECYLRNETCNLLVMEAMIYEDTESSQTMNAIISVSVVITVAATLVVVFICVFRLRIARNKKKAASEYGSAVADKQECVPLNEIPKNEPLPDAGVYAGAPRQAEDVKERAFVEENHPDADAYSSLYDDEMVKELVKLHEQLEIYRPDASAYSRSLRYDELVKEREEFEKTHPASNRSTHSDASSQTEEIPDECEPVERHIPIQRRSLDICGLATLNQEVFISLVDRSDIDVYDSSTFDFKRRIKVRGMTDPDDIVSCSVKKCLYATNFSYKMNKIPSILRIDPVNGKLITSWNIQGSSLSRPRARLSIASDTHVILTGQYCAELFEYKAGGELVQRIDLHIARKGGNENFHGVKLPNGLYVVGHSQISDPQSKVILFSIKKKRPPYAFSIVDVEVEIIATYFPQKRESTIHRCGRSICLSVNKEGLILFSDESNSQAVLLSSELIELQTLVTEKHDIGAPGKTCFDASTGRWFVADDHYVMVCWVKDEGVERKRHSLIDPGLPTVPDTSGQSQILLQSPVIRID